LSEGCITLQQPSDFTKPHDALKKGPAQPISRGTGQAYGTVDVQ